MILFGETGQPLELIQKKSSALPREPSDIS